MNQFVVLQNNMARFFSFRCIACNFLAFSVHHGQSQPCSSLTAVSCMSPQKLVYRIHKQKNILNGFELCSTPKSISNEVPRGGSLSDYSGEAQGLFRNVIGPASMLTGGLVALGFASATLPAEHPTLKSLHSFLAVLSLCNVLLAIIYGTVAQNKLAEVASEPTESVFALLQRDYELFWIAVNVHFMCGLVGFMFMLMIRSYTMFPEQLRAPSAGIAGSVAFLSLSIINRGVSKGDGLGQRFGGSVLALIARYIYLLSQELLSCRTSPLEVVALIVFAISFALALRGTFIVK